MYCITFLQSEHSIFPLYSSSDSISFGFRCVFHYTRYTNCVQCNVCLWVSTIVLQLYKRATKSFCFCGQLSFIRTFARTSNIHRLTHSHSTHLISFRLTACAFFCTYTKQRPTNSFIHSLNLDGRLRIQIGIGKQTIVVFIFND